jgi:hypothetical protein
MAAGGPVGGRRGHRLELVTNAGLASRPLVSPVIGLVLTFDRGELAILVRDFCPGVPQPRQAGADDESGRGLLPVESMSDRSGWYPFEDGTPGKVVWAAIQATPAASSDLTARFMPSAPA